MECVDWWCRCHCAWNDALRARIVGEASLLTEDLVVVAVDDVVSEQVVLTIVMEVVVADQCSVQVVDMMVAVIDDRLCNEDVIVVIQKLLRITIGAVCVALILRRQAILVSSILL